MKVYVWTPGMCWEQLHPAIFDLCKHLTGVRNSFILQYLVYMNRTCVGDSFIPQRIFALCEHLTGVGNNFILQYLVYVSTWCVGNSFIPQRIFGLCEHLMCVGHSFILQRIFWSMWTPDRCWKQLYPAIFGQFEHPTCVGNSFILQYSIYVNTWRVGNSFIPQYLVYVNSWHIYLASNIWSMSTPDIVGNSFILQ